MRKRRIAVLGSTGSIGMNTLRVIARHPDHFEVAALTACNSVRAIERQIRTCQPKYVALARVHILPLEKKFPGIRFFDVAGGLEELVVQKDIDVVVIAMTGAAALAPFLAAARAGKIIAPANKEALVMAGDILMASARRHGAKVIPVDSEQSAIFQCLEGRRPRDLYKVHLTASGGALRNVPSSRHDRFSVKEVLAHPRWKMGAKITVDSATLMNKGFEVIEAQRLFDLGSEMVHVVIHPEAIVHSMVEFCDGSILAQLSATDMRLPIQYALGYPARLPAPVGRLDFARLGKLTFARPDVMAFPLLALAFEVARAGGVLPAVLNAADEVAVSAFLQGMIKFTGIHRIVAATVHAHRGLPSCRKPDLKDIEMADTWARVKATEIMERIR